MDFAREMRNAGCPAVVVYADDEGAIRMATLEISAELMTVMLTTAMEAYAARARLALN